MSRTPGVEFIEKDGASYRTVELPGGGRRVTPLPGSEVPR